MLPVLQAAAQAPAKPCTPASLEPLIEAYAIRAPGLMRLTRPTAGALVDTASEADARRHRDLLRAYLAPPDRTWLSWEIATMLANYRHQDMPEGMLDRVSRDWVDILADLPQVGLVEARRSWLRNSKYRPTIRDIAELAEDYVGFEMRLLALLERCLESPA